MAGNPRMSSGRKCPRPESGSEHIPCYRVVNFRGELVRGFCLHGGKDVQKKLLEADGIEVVNGTVDLKIWIGAKDDKL